VSDLRAVTTAADHPVDCSWPWSEIDMSMWAAHGAGYDIGDPAVATDLHGDWDPRTALASVTGDNTLAQQSPNILLAAAWAGLAAYATANRDDAIRAAVSGGLSQRQVAVHVGLTHPGVARIVQRG